MSRPDPRATRSREAILSAARDLLLHHGPGAVTHQRVADQAGVGRATVYRHWARTDQLLLDVMAGADLPFFRDPTTPVRQWLQEQLRLLAADLAQPAARAVSLTLMQGALWDDEIARRRDASAAVIAERLGAALDLAVSEGELGDHPGGVDAAAALVGPLVYRVTMQNGDITGDLINRLINGVGPWR